MADSNEQTASPALEVDSRELEAFRQQLLQVFLRGHLTFEGVAGLSEESILGMAVYARDLAEEGQLEDARELLSSLAQLEPQLGYVYSCLGAVEMQLADLDAAAAALRRALALAPDDIAANANLGEVYLEQGRFEAAARYLRAAIELDPESADPFAERARALAAITTAARREADEQGPQAFGRLQAVRAAS
jgi:Flp pilus assembly protein TadD